MVIPCATCTTGAPCPCPVFLAWDAAEHPIPPERECLVCREVEYQRGCGEQLEQIAPRVLDSRGRPFRLDSLERHLAKHGRHDLARQAVA